MKIFILMIFLVPHEFPIEEENNCKYIFILLKNLFPLSFLSRILKKKFQGVYDIKFLLSKIHKNEISFYLYFGTHEIALMKFFFFFS